VSGDDLPEPELNCLKRMLSEDKRRYQTGQTVARKGECVHTYMHILEGMVTIRAEDDSVLSIRTKGDSVLESSFLAHGNRGNSSRVVAETDLVLQCLPFDKVERIALSMPMVGACIFRSLGWSLLRRSHQQTTQLLAGEQHITAHQGSDPAEMSQMPSH